MADSLSEGSGSEEYECKICVESDFDLERRIPKELGCSHTFCQECLEGLHSREGGGWRVGCPVCRHRTPVPEYKVTNLPTDNALAELLLIKAQQQTDSPRTDEQVTQSAPSVTSQQSCETCKHIAFTTGCACAMFSFLAMVVLLFVGLIFVHNFNHTASPVGAICLFTASVLAPFSLILTWLMCMMKYRPETPDLSSPTSNRF